MRCPFCGHDDSQVKDSRPTEDNSAIRRRRQCEGCGGRFTTFERIQLRELVVINKKVAYSADKVSSLAWSPDGEIWAAAVQTGKEKRVVRNGAEHPAFEEVTKLTFSPASSAMGYLGFRDRQWVVVQDGLESEPYMDIDELSFSPDGRQLAFLGRIKGQGTALTNNGERDSHGRRVRPRPPVDPADVLTDGRRFQNIDEFKQLLLTDKDQLARNLAEKLLAYATGAEPTPLDRPQIDVIVRRVSEQGTGFRALIHEIVQSSLFQTK